VLQITVDQLRGDLPGRYVDRMEPGGFRYLLDQGTWYANAHYRHANTETAVGHATLVTGADPSRHGLVANEWVDQETGEFVYNTEDDRHRVLGEPGQPDDGVSPRNLAASTIGDELVVHTGGASRAFSVSVKDRGAIIPGGHAGEAYWFSKRTGRFVTSTFYHDTTPGWVEDWNGKGLADGYRGASWELLDDPSTYVQAAADDRPFETSFGDYGRIFPHPFGDGTSPYFYALLTFSPMGDELTLDFAKTLMTEERVGLGEATDYMAISFSSTDYVGHLFGPSSLESEDNLLRLDRVLADLFAFVDEHVGLDNTLIVLSADHGAPEAPEHMAGIGMDTGRIDFDWFESPAITEALLASFGRDDLIGFHSHPYLYLDLETIASAQLDVADVERVVADAIMQMPGFTYALTRSELMTGAVAGAPVQEQIRRSFHPTRSGNIHMVQNQYWFLHSDEDARRIGIAAIHGSPWVYDTYVPVIFAGHGIPAQTVHRRVGPHDIAATLAGYLNIKPPSGSIGNPLREVLPHRR
jgi:hypothetical protein